MTKKELPKVMQVCNLSKSFTKASLDLKFMRVPLQLAISVLYAPKSSVYLDWREIHTWLFFLNNHTWYFYGNSSLPIKLPKSMHSNLLNLNAPRVSFTPFGLVNELVLNKVGVKHW
jgi:hypothetical protein